MPTVIRLIYDRTGEVTDEVRRDVGQIVNDIAWRILREAVVSIQTGRKSGRLYRRGKNRWHRASAPGEAPATDTGLLASSGYQKQVGPLLREVGFTADYAPYLEFGTGRIAPRPFLRPAVARWAQAFYDRIGAILR